MNNHTINTLIDQSLALLERPRNKGTVPYRHSEPHLPWMLRPVLDSDLYIVVNGRYKPLGLPDDAWYNYEDHPDWHVDLAELDLNFAKASIPHYIDGSRGEVEYILAPPRPYDREKYAQNLRAIFRRPKFKGVNKCTDRRARG